MNSTRLRDSPYSGDTARTNSSCLRQERGRAFRQDKRLDENLLGKYDSLGTTCTHLIRDTTTFLGRRTHKARQQLKHSRLRMKRTSLRLAPAPSTLSPQGILCKSHLQWTTRWDGTVNNLHCLFHPELAMQFPLDRACNQCFRPNTYCTDTLRRETW